MASKGQMTGMLGVYLTAVELVKRGFIVSPTSRSAMGADLLITDQQCCKAWSVQVKTNSSDVSFWLVSAKSKEAVSATHIYVFVNVPKKSPPQFYIVPSRTVARSIKTSHTKSGLWHSYFREKKDDRFRDNWKVFGNPLGAIPKLPQSN